MRVLFVYNKKAGKKYEPSVVDLISELIPSSIQSVFLDIREFDAFDTTSFDRLVAIGGDGTVNTVAKRSREQHKTLGVIPKGSGDGLARFLRIPRNSTKAVAIFLEGKTIEVDTATLSGHFFINVAGAGFEGNVAHQFGKGGLRGLKGYTKSIIDLFGKQEEEEIILLMDGKEITVPFFSLSLANGAQWGNNFEVASAADIQDGLLDIAIMRKPKIHQILSLMSYLRTKKQKNNKMFTYFKAAKVVINSSGLNWHIDGEPISLNGGEEVVVSAKSLKIIVPQNF